MRKINTNITNKILITLLAITFVLAVISNVIISSDLRHLEECHLENCEECIMIHQAINFLNLLAAILIITVSSYFINIYLIKRLNLKSFISNTLVNSKIQFNE